MSFETINLFPLISVITTGVPFSRNSPSVMTSNISLPIPAFPEGRRKVRASPLSPIFAEFASIESACESASVVERYGPETTREKKRFG